MALSGELSAGDRCRASLCSGALTCRSADGTHLALVCEQAPAAPGQQGTACVWLVRLADWTQKVVQLETLPAPHVPFCMLDRIFLRWSTAACSRAKLALVTTGPGQAQLCARQPHVLDSCEVHVIHRASAQLLLDVLWSPDGRSAALLYAREIALYAASSGRQRSCSLQFKLNCLCFSWAPCGCHMILLPRDAPFDPQAREATGGLILDAQAQVVAPDVMRAFQACVRDVHWGAAVVAVSGLVSQPTWAGRILGAVWLCALRNKPGPPCLQPLHQLAASAGVHSPQISPCGHSSASGMTLTRRWTPWAAGSTSLYASTASWWWQTCPLGPQCAWQRARTARHSFSWTPKFPTRAAAHRPAGLQTHAACTF